MGVRAQPIGGFSGNLRAWGSSTRDFLPTVWELIPYSFVVDYFTNIGNMIDSLSIIESDIGWKDYTSHQICSRYSNGAQFTGLKSLFPHSVGYNIEDEQVEAGSQEVTKKIISRGQYGGSLTPGLQFKLPGAGSLKWLNLAALGQINSRPSLAGRGK